MPLGENKVQFNLVPPGAAAFATRPHSPIAPRRLQSPRRQKRLAVAQRSSAAIGLELCFRLMASPRMLVAPSAFTTSPTTRARRALSSSQAKAAGRQRRTSAASDEKTSFHERAPNSGLPSEWRNMSSQRIQMHHLNENRMPCRALSVRVIEGRSLRRPMCTFARRPSTITPRAESVPVVPPSACAPAGRCV